MKIIDIPQATLDLLSYRIDDNEPWPDPEELVINLEPVAPYDPELLPDVLREFVADISYRMQAPPDFVAVSYVATIGAVVGASCGVHPKQEDDWFELPNLWGGAVGGPSTMKTPAISAGSEPLSWLEHDAKLEHEGEMSRYTLDKLDRDHELKQLKSDKAASKLGISEDEVHARIRKLAANPPKEPKMRRYKSNDSTIEMLTELIRDNPRGILVMRDELVGLLANCNRQGHEGDRSFYLESWNGKHSFAVDRIGRGSIVLPNLCLSIFGGIQPAKLQEYIAGTMAGYDNDGLLQRFQLMVYPDEITDWQYVDQARDTEVRDRVVGIVRTLANADFVSMGACQEGNKPPCFRFTASAQKVFVEWLTSQEGVIRKIEHPIMAEHLSKYRKLIPALALIFHLVDLANGGRRKPPGISKAALQRAIRWGQYLESHARRIYSMAMDPVVNSAHSLAAKIKAGKLPDGFSERDVYKAGWATLNDPELVHAACAELEQEAWLRRIPVERGAGRPASPSYLINPKILGK